MNIIIVLPFILFVLLCRISENRNETIRLLCLLLESFFSIFRGPGDLQSFFGSNLQNVHTIVSLKNRLNIQDATRSYNIKHRNAGRLALSACQTGIGSRAPTLYLERP